MNWLSTKGSRTYQFSDDLSNQLIGNYLSTMSTPSMDHLVPLVSEVWGKNPGRARKRPRFL